MGITTNAGLAKIAAATPLNPVNIKFMAFSDALGAINASRTALTNEVLRVNASGAVKDPSNEKNLIIQGAIPVSELQGVEVFEVGLFDDSGVLMAIASLADESGNGQYKPDGDSAIAAKFTFDFVFAMSNASDFDLIVFDNPEFNHNNMTGRSNADSHPPSAITGLVAHMSDTVSLTQNQEVSGNKTFLHTTIFKQIASFFGGAFIDFRLGILELVTSSLTHAASIKLDGNLGKVDVVGQLNVPNGIIGNASTSTLAAEATKLASARTIQVVGAVTGGAVFDGSTNVTITTNPNSDALRVVSGAGYTATYDDNRRIVVIDLDIWTNGSVESQTSATTYAFSRYKLVTIPVTIKKRMSVEVCLTEDGTSSPYGLEAAEWNVIPMRAGYNSSNATNQLYLRFNRWSGDNNEPVSARATITAMF